MSSQEISVFDLSPAEKLQLVEEHWDDIAATREAAPVHRWQKDELMRRKAHLKVNPAPTTTWQEVKQRVWNRRGR